MTKIHYGLDITGNTPQNHVNTARARFEWADAIFKMTPTQKTDHKHLDLVMFGIWIQKNPGFCQMSISSSSQSHELLT